MTQKRLHRLFRYRSGYLYSRTDRKNGLKCGAKLLGYIDAQGYRILSIDNKSYKYHRMIFLHQRGFLPPFLDHRNGDRSDNKIRNLRPATPSQNQANIKVVRGEYKGVSFVPRTGRYISHIGFEGKLIHIGYFATAKEAARAYDKKAKNLFGDFARTNL